MRNLTKGLVALGVAASAVAALPMLSMADTLTTPTNLSPSNGASLTSDQWASASWGAVSGSSTPITYQYESANSSSTNADGSFASPIYQSGPLTSPQISTTGTVPGTYWWHVRATDGVGSSTPWSTASMVTVTSGSSTGTTTPPTSDDRQALITALLWLQGQHPAYYWNLQWVIDQLNNQGSGTTTAPSGSAQIDNPNRLVGAGGAVDWVGRNFGHEETVNIMRGGTLVGTAHADGGGNFSTGSMLVPGLGTYSYTFTGVTSARSATATLTVK